MSKVVVIDIVLGILTIAVTFGVHALKRLHEAVSSYAKGFGEEAGKIDATMKKIDELQIQCAITLSKALHDQCT